MRRSPALVLLLLLAALPVATEAAPLAHHEVLPNGIRLLVAPRPAIPIVALRVYLPKFTLTTVVAEINRWWHTGQSCFSKLLKSMKLNTPAESILDNPTF